MLSPTRISPGSRRLNSEEGELGPKSSAESAGGVLDAGGAVDAGLTLPGRRLAYGVR
jgi:hypothetical protein